MAANVESIVEAEIVEYAKANGGRAFKLKIEGLRGWPDRTLILPGRVIVFPEAKRPKGNKASPQQIEIIEFLRACGFQAEVVRTLDEVKAMVERDRQQCKT
jgi:hypothetical protein